MYISRTGEKTPDGKGYVVDHFDSIAVAHHLAHLDSALKVSGKPYPKAFFNDTYEAYEANWTPTLLEEFAKQHGYELEEHFPEFLDGDPTIVSDYRATISSLFLRNFTQQWTAWAHQHGAITRYQACGSPTNVIDAYATADIPVTKLLGLTDFPVKGLRYDPNNTCPQFNCLTLLKFAPSAAHITGKKFTAYELFKGTKHSRISQGQMKPNLDFIFCTGVNDVLVGNTPHSPCLDDYVTRCQSYLQMGAPDNDFLVYLPIRDFWRGDTIDFVRAIMKIDSLGYDCDFVSDQYLTTTTYKDGILQTANGARYKSLVIPGNNIMPTDLIQHIAELKGQGAHIVQGIKPDKLSQAAQPEELKSKHGLRLIRRSNPNGYHYFITNLTDDDIDVATDLAVDFKYALWYDPMTDARYAAEFNNNKLRVYLRSGESRILLCSKEPIAEANGLTPMPMPEVGSEVIDLNTFTTTGKNIHEITVKMNKDQAASQWRIELGTITESAFVYINDQEVGCVWASPYTLTCPNIFVKGKNVIRIECPHAPTDLKLLQVK